MSHGCLVPKGFSTLEQSCITELVTTDGIPSPPAGLPAKVRVLSVAELLAEAIRRIHEGRSVPSLFQLPEEE